MDYVFLICSERSGSNLVTKIFDAHPDFCGPSPVHIIRAFANNILRYGDIQLENNWICLTEDIAKYFACQLGKWETNITADMLQNNVNDRTLSALIDFIYEREAAANKKLKVFIKENQTYQFMPFLLTSFPDAKYLFQVRDPRDMAFSWKLSPAHPGSVMKATEVWKNDQNHCLLLYGYLKDKNIITISRYEDLIASTETELKRICQFFNISYSDSMLNFHNNELTKDNSYRISSWHNLGSPVKKNNYAKYSDGLSEIEIRYIEEICRPEMEYFNYQCEYPSPVNFEKIKEQVEHIENIYVKESKLSSEEQILREARLKMISVITDRKL